MRVQAVVEIIHSDSNMASKPVRSSISIGKKPKSDKDAPNKIVLLVCNATNRSGMQFNVIGNISRVFDKFLSQGKCTIQIIKPAKKIIISKADPLQLKGLLGLMKKVLCSKTEEELNAISLTCGSLAPASTAQVTKPKEKLIVLDKRDYPITKSFSSDLTTLKVNKISLNRFDSRILKLKKLTSLDLSDNNISRLPESLATLLNLQELRLAGNKLTTLPVTFLLSLPKSLWLLDLSRNSLGMIPYMISRLSNLVELNLSNNHLKRLPLTIDHLKSLKRLGIAGNANLNVMPGSFVRLRLDHLSISASCLTEDVSSLVLRDTTTSMPDLLDICIVRCSNLKLRSQVSEEILPYRVLEYWDTLQRCPPCGKICHWSSCVRGIVKTSPNRIAQTLVTDGGSGSFLRCESLFCSSKCIEFYRNQPLNFR